MLIQPYLTFNGRCEEAVNFYREALGATVEMMMRFEESPDPMPPGMLAPGFEKKVMHSSLRIGDAVLMASDGMGHEPMAFKGFSLSITVADPAAADKAFNALGAGGSVQMPLGKTFWSPYFGMLTDRFGVAWMVGIAE